MICARQGFLCSLRLSMVSCGVRVLYALTPARYTPAGLLVILVLELTRSVRKKIHNGQHSATQPLRANTNVCVWRAGGVLGAHIPALS